MHFQKNISTDEIFIFFLEFSLTSTSLYKVVSKWKGKYRFVHEKVLFVIRKTSKYYLNVRQSVSNCHESFINYKKVWLSEFLDTYKKNPNWTKQMLSKKSYLFLLKTIGLCFYELLIIICLLFTYDDMTYDSDYFIHHRSQNGWYNWSFLKEVIKVVELYYVVFWDWCKLLGILETSMVSWKSY